MSNSEILLPALRCRMGDWIYYITALRFKEIADRVTFAERIHKSKALKEQLQRDLTPRAKQIANYLLTTDQRLFNALTVAVYGGDPEWLDVALSASSLLNPDQLGSEVGERIDSTLGLLRLSGKEELFALDGQHRVSGIKQALMENGELFDDEVCVIFVGHKNDEDGLIRSRRLFTTLNRYAKPVSKSDIVALDEDDASAIVTRRLLNEHPLLTGIKTTAGAQTSIPRSDKSSFTTIIAVYEVCNALLRNTHIGDVSWSNKRLRGPRPSEGHLEALYSCCADFWNALTESFPSVREMRDSSEVSTEVAGKYRTSEGGSLLFRPIAQVAVAKATRELAQKDCDFVEAMQLLTRVDMELSSRLWSGVLWNSASRTMTTTARHRDLAADLMIYMVGGRVNLARLKSRYKALLDDETADLPTPVGG